MTKPELINALAILLNLEPKFKSDLNSLKSDTVQAIYDSYLENARQANFTMEKEIAKAIQHTSTTCRGKTCDKTQRPRTDRN